MINIQVFKIIQFLLLNIISIVVEAKLKLNINLL